LRFLLFLFLFLLFFFAATQAIEATETVTMIPKRLQRRRNGDTHKSHGRPELDAFRILGVPDRGQA
jgi:predicted RND superfamily exporter protein